MNQEHPLLQENVVKQEFNFSKFIGQVAMGVAVTLTVRYLVQRWDIFAGKIKK